MSIEMVLYLIDVVHNLSALLVFTFFVIIMPGVIWVVAVCDVCDVAETVKRLKGKLLLAVLMFILIGLTMIATPSQKTMYMMLACNVAKKSEIPEKVMKAIELKLDEYIDEVKDKVKK